MSWQSKVELRFSELVVKVCLETASKADEAKFERYQILRRKLLGSFYTTPAQARIEYETNCLAKRIRRMLLSTLTP